MNPKVPEQFDGFSIVQLSDLHHKNFGENQSELISKVLSCNPDIVLLTGDIVDEDHSDMQPIQDLLAGLDGKTEIYYVSGNHDICNDATANYNKLRELFVIYNVVDLDDNTITIERNGASITLTGSMWRSKDVKDFLPSADSDTFSILAYHGADYFDILDDFGYDLIFAGHIHGGIIRLPILGGLLDNLGGFFPKYSGGAYMHGDCTLISNRGLGDSRLPRFNNRPEIVHTILRH